MTRKLALMGPFDWGGDDIIRLLAHVYQEAIRICDDQRGDMALSDQENLILRLVFGCHCF